jgi:transposase
MASGWMWDYQVVELSGVHHAKRGGRSEQYPKREIFNGIFYIVRGGSAWRLLPLITGSRRDRGYGRYRI